jgi:ABC-2 type transport system ATP-binding protein
VATTIPGPAEGGTGSDATTAPPAEGSGAPAPSVDGEGAGLATPVPRGEPEGTVAEVAERVMAAEEAAHEPPVILARDLGVKYSLRFTKKTTLHRTFTDMFRRQEGPTDFWALRHFELELKKGESLGVIGPNGAGKSTLLQVLAGILTPSEGTVEVRGAISSLLTLGAGFDQELSGRDNILLAGAFMGVDHREMERRMDDIIEFTDIGEFIDVPIKTYSSGMRARLGFSIATSVDPDVLLLDEVLSTGDQLFRAKSKARVLELVKSAKAIVLVTHDLQWVNEFCNRAILLEHGAIMAAGEPAPVVKLHQERMEEERQRKAAEIRRYGGAVSR